MFLSSMVTGTANYLTSCAKQATGTAAQATKVTVKGAADYFHGTQDPIHNLKKEIQTSLAESQFGKQLQRLSPAKKFQLMILLIHKNVKSNDSLKKMLALNEIESFIKQNILGNDIQERLDGMDDTISIKSAESPYSASDYTQALTAFQYEKFARMQGTVLCGTAETVIRFLFLPDDSESHFSFYDILTTLSADVIDDHDLNSYSDLPVFYDFLKQYFHLKNEIELFVELQKHRILWMPYFNLKNATADLKLNGINFSHSTFEHCDFENNSFIETNFSHSNIKHCQFKNCHFTASILENASFEYCQLELVQFNGVQLDHASFALSEFKHIFFRNECSFNGLNIEDSKINDVILTEDTILGRVVVKECSPLVASSYVGYTAFEPIKGAS